MKIGELQRMMPSIQQPDKQKKAEGQEFENLISGFINDVKTDQIDAKKLTEDFVTGKGNIEIHDVMIAGEKAKTSLQLLMEIRNKTLDMYKELTRIQI